MKTKRVHIGVYVAAVIVALGIVNYVSWLTSGVRFGHVASMSIGFLLGMFAMHIIAHVRRWDGQASSGRGR